MYTTEKNIQILIALLKAHGIRKIIASPGSMNATFVNSVQQDDFFEVFSCVDERSAAYMACGMSEECQAPVVLSCTGATSSRNYLPALTEAFYRKLPVLAVTSLSKRENIGQLIGQQIDRSNPPKDVVVESVYIPVLHNVQEEKICEREINKAILALTLNGGGPVHIDLGTCMALVNAEKLPDVRVMHRYSHGDTLPPIPDGRIGIMIGAHARMDEALIHAIDNFCASYDALVLSVNPKSYNGKYSANVGLLFSQIGYKDLNQYRLLIHIGEVNTDAVGFVVYPEEVWRVSEDGIVRDRYGVLTNIFQMTEYEFFAGYAQRGIPKDSQYKTWRATDSELRNHLPELPFCTAWIAQYVAPKFPDDAELYLGILNSLRSFDYANPSPKLLTRANTGGFGIDGCISSMIGASVVSPQKQFYGIFGDLAFFYDINVLGNRHIGKNVHIMLINNDGGQLFRNADHPLHNYMDVNQFIAAAGHNGKQSETLVKSVSESLGFVYLTAKDKETFSENFERWLNSENSVVFEVFTNAEDDEQTFLQIRTLMLPEQKNSSSDKIKNSIKRIVGAERIQTLKALIGI